MHRWRVAAVVTELADYTDDDWANAQIALACQAIEASRSHGDFARGQLPVAPDGRCRFYSLELKAISYNKTH